MTEKTLTTENIKSALDALRGELAPWPVVAKKQDRLNDTQKSAVNSGITSSLVAQIIANTAAIRALESAITGTGLRPIVVASLPAIGTQGILYIVPVTTYDPATDADVVNYSNEYIWIVAPDAPVTEGYYEQVGQTGIVINNGQLTITVNGTSVGTFTANQSGDTTAAITVPTNADYVDKTTAQSIAGDKTFTGSNTFNNILPNATNTYSLGSSSYQWSSVYAQSYYYNGTAWGLDKANVWSASNTFNQAVISNSSFWITSTDLQAKNQSTLTSARLNKIGNESSDGKAFQKFEMKVDATYTDTAYCVNYYNTSGNIAYDFVIRQKVDNQGTKQFYPSVSGVAELGTSTNKWKSVYAQSYYYNGTAWGLDKANEWTGSNKFKSANSNFGLQSTTAEAGSTTATSNWIYWQDKNGFQDAYISRDVWSDGGDTLRISISGKRSNGAPSTSGASVECGIRLDITANGYKSVRPFDNGGTDLGTSTNKWKTLNGVNPGALSLPDSANAVNIDITNWDKRATNNVIGSITASMDGWINVQIQRDVDFAVWVIGTYRQLFRAGIQSNGKYLVMLMLPVTKNATVTLYTLPLDALESDLVFGVYRFYPCLGNV